MISIDDLRYWRRDEHMYGRHMLIDVHANILDRGCQVILVYAGKDGYGYATYGTYERPVSDSSLIRLLELLSSVPVRKRVKSNNDGRVRQFSELVGDNRSFIFRG